MASKINFDSYDTAGFLDEMMAEDHSIRPHYEIFKERIDRMGWKRLNSLQHSADRAQLSLGMTFNVYNDNQGVERILHLDLIPRIIDGEEWSFLERGLKQRIEVLNLFISDLYNEQKILKEKINAIAGSHQGFKN
ncbi:MAG: circularly permuted type 2 ATP-grasp protein [Cyclobacteriaceae bacterium]